MGMGLGAKLGRVLRLLVFGIGRRWVGNIAAAFEIEVQVPSAYYAISAT